jgi:multiple sugar transport system substrate-binding protein
MKRLALLVFVLAAVTVACGGSDDKDSGASSSGPVKITFWHGQNQQSEKVLKDLVAKFNQSHPKIHVDVSSGGVLADQMLQKVTAGLAAGSYPDVAYIFGSDVPNLVRSPKVADLTDAVKRPGWDWDDVYPAARSATTVNGRVRAAPALIDDLAVVYNKKLFKQAGVPEPQAGWTWDDFRATAKRMTDKSKGTFGTGWPGVGDEDTVWRIWPLIWQLGGDIATPDGKAVGFDGPSGLRALTLINDMATKDKSVYVDVKPGSEQMYQVFESGKMAMVPTGPWQLPEITEQKVDYGVVQMPSFSGKPTTISGPDTWMVLDNGDARKAAAIEFVKWLGQPTQDAVWDQQAGSLPLRKATLQQPQWQSALSDTPGMKVFVDELANARVRPALRAYPKVSQAMGQSIVSVLLGKASPQDALKSAVDAGNTALSTSGP